MNPEQRQSGNLGSDDRTKNFFRRLASFSFVFFKGNVSTQIPRLLEKVGYKVLESHTVKANLPQLYASLPAPSGPKNSLVAKAFCTVSGYTVLCEPEMVLFTNSKELADFCSENSTEITTAIWERVSETVALMQISASGVTSETFCIAGEIQGEQKEPHKLIQDNPGEEGLLQALSELGIPLSELNGEVEATVLKLQE